MTQTISYKEAVKRIANLEDYFTNGKKIDAFDRSSILATLFNVEKEKALAEIINIRASKFNIKNKLKKVI